MTPALRQAAIIDSLIFAVQRKKVITNREREDVLWILRNNGWKLDARALIPTDLRNRILEVCPLLAERDGGATSDTPNEKEQHRGA
jgi:hypothetical protein